MSNKESQLSKAEILSALPSFSGTTQYHRLTLFPLMATDGVAYVAESCQAFWLIDLIAPHWLKLKQKEDFLAVACKVKDSSMTVTIEDGNDRVLVRQKVSYTDFPLDEIRFFVTGDVIMLPSEY